MPEEKNPASSHKAEEHASAKHAAPTSVQTGPVPVKNHEARTVGAGQEEQHRLLKENVEDGKAERHPDLPAGIHSTGSFTGKNENKK
ncbi:MAG TPA: hypothetical protein VHB45_08090 [Alloacidobacterium sp.]|nr:hypothetical protein [Alloacidobacterium sp.]